MSRKTKVAIQQAAGVFKKDLVSIVECEVVSVDLDNRQITVQPTNGSSDAQFVADISADPNDGMIVTPSVGSTVKVACSVENNPFVLMFSDFDGVSFITNDGVTQFIINQAGQIQFNDGSYGGLIKIQSLVTKLNNLENIVNDIITKYDTHTHVTTCGAGAGTAAVTTSLETGTLTPTVKADIENSLITHGQ
jgi:hypothetical protein